MQKIILVTGGNKGIGKALCQKLLSTQSDTFVLLGSRDAERGRAAVESIVNAVEGAHGRIDMVNIDVTDDDSVSAAARSVLSKYGSSSNPTPLYGIVNNAGGHTRDDFEGGVQLNLYGPRRVCDAFLPLLSTAGGRIVNISSAAGPMFVANLPEEDKAFFTKAPASWEDIEDKVSFARNPPDSWTQNSFGGYTYGFTKACLNLYTMQLARDYPSLTVAAVTPGLIDTDLTRSFGMANAKPPEEGTIAPMFALLDDNVVSGAYYGSDAVRSPLDAYRSPGDPPYEPE